MNLNQINRVVEEKAEKLIKIADSFADDDDSDAAAIARENAWIAEHALDEIYLLKQSLDIMEIKYEEPSDAQATIQERMVQSAVQGGPQQRTDRA